MNSFYFMRSVQNIKKASLDAFLIFIAPGYSGDSTPRKPAETIDVNRSHKFTGRPNQAHKYAPEFPAVYSNN
jgi:hypothetical protein